MAKLLGTAQAGTMESSDLLITVAPGDVGCGIQMTLESPMKIQYGDQIKAAVKAALAEFALTDVAVDINDKGALDCTIHARVRTAVERAGLEG